MQGGIVHGLTAALWGRMSFTQRGGQPGELQPVPHDAHAGHAPHRGGDHREHGSARGSGRARRPADRAGGRERLVPADGYAGAVAAAAVTIRTGGADRTGAAAVRDRSGPDRARGSSRSSRGDRRSGRLCGSGLINSASSRVGEVGDLSGTTAMSSSVQTSRRPDATTRWAAGNFHHAGRAPRPLRRDRDRDRRQPERRRQVGHRRGAPGRVPDAPRRRVTAVDVADEVEHRLRDQDRQHHRPHAGDLGLNGVLRPRVAGNDPRTGPRASALITPSMSSNHTGMEGCVMSRDVTRTSLSRGLLLRMRAAPGARSDLSALDVRSTVCLRSGEPVLDRRVPPDPQQEQRTGHHQDRVVDVLPGEAGVPRRTAGSTSAAARRSRSPRSRRRRRCTSTGTCCPSVHPPGVKLLPAFQRRKIGMRERDVQPDDADRHDGEERDRRRRAADVDLDQRRQREDDRDRPPR